MFALFSIAVLIGNGLTRSEINTNTAEKTEPDVYSATGEMLYQKNCARCHKAKPGDPQPPDERDWGMKPAQLGGISVKYRLGEFENILNSGPCYMPSFESLTVNDKRDIYSYLKTMEDIYEVSGGSMGMGCRNQCRNR